MTERMFTNRVVRIFTSPEKGAPMESQEEIKVIAGKGIIGDRYGENKGAYSGTARLPDVDRQITLISQHGIDKANADLIIAGHLPISASETRRNVVVDMDSDELRLQAGKQFKLGEIVLEGVEDCAPCRRPPTVLGRPKDGEAFEIAFEKRGGLRARILNDGHIQIEDQLVFQSK